MSTCTGLNGTAADLDSMATMGKYVVAYELAIKTVSRPTLLCKTACADNVGMVEQGSHSRTSHRAGYPHLQVFIVS